MIQYSDKNLSQKYRVALYALFFMVPINTPVMADHPTPAFGTATSGPINTISAGTLARGQWAIGLRTEIINSDIFSDEELENLAGRGIEGVHSIDRTSSTSLALAYGVSDNLTLSVRLPYVTRNHIREGELEDGVAEIHSKGDATGIGDATLFGQYRFFKDNSTSASFLFGAKAPTGKTDVDNQGARLDAELQPGSGSWDVLAGVALSRQHRRMGYHANVLYNKTTEGSQNTDIGDAFFYNAALSYRLSNGERNHPHQDAAEHGHLVWDLLLELNGEARGKTRVATNSEPHSGGRVIYITPGIRVSSSAGWTGFLSLGVPVSENLNGVQTGVNYRLVAGMSFGF